MDKRKVNAAFATLLLTTTIIASLLPQTTANPTTITAITPASGRVGTTVRVIGETDTLNGSYQIRWDGETIMEGTCEPNTQTVNDTFEVPLSGEGGHEVTLYDVNSTNESSPESFTVVTSYYVSAEPARMQEGLNTSITAGINGAEANKTYLLRISVTDPQPTPESYTANLTVSTDTEGSGSNSTVYYANFSVGANTNYVGNYTVAVIADNETLNTVNFTVGLTDKLEYRRTEAVNIQGSGYDANETVTINIITAAGAPVNGYPKNITANTGGGVADSWEIPIDFMLGTYTVTLTNATAPGTAKTQPDAQNFTVFGAICQIQTKNLAEEPVADVTVEVYNAETYFEITNATGWASFVLDPGNYTFKAFWKDVEVGILPDQIIGENKTLTLKCSLANVEIAANDEADVPLPFINVTLMYNYTTRLNETIPVTESFETDDTGTIKLYNMFTNICYTIEARRYGFLFNTTFIEKLPAQPWVNVAVVCPTYTISVYVLDSKGEPLANVELRLTEWSSEILMGSRITDDQGSVGLSATFGRYEVKVYNYSTLLEPEVILNKTVIDLIEDNITIEIHCKIFNVNLYVETLDYFGQPIRNALVEIQRKTGEDWVKIDSSFTRPDGFARFEPLGGLVGGDCRVSVFVAGKLGGVKDLYLVGSTQIQFKIGRFTAIAGNPIETSQLIVYILIGLLVIMFGLALSYRKLLPKLGKKKKES